MDVLQGFPGMVRLFTTDRKPKRWYGRVENFAGDLVAWVSRRDCCATRNEVELLLRERLAEWRAKNEQAS